MRLDLSRRTNRELLTEFRALVEKVRRSTAELLAYVGEVQARKLFVPAGYSSMYSYCVHELHMSEDMAWKRTRVARLARRFPRILEMIAEGSLHLTAVVKLLPYRMAPDFPQLLEAAAYRTKSEIELLLAERFPRPDAPTVVRPLAMSTAGQKLVPEPVVQTHVSHASHLSGCDAPVSAIVATVPSADGPDVLAESASPSGELAPARFEAPPARVEPLAPQRFAIQVTVGEATHDKLRRAQDLLGHEVPPGDLEQVVNRALDALIRQLEHEKHAATEKPRRGKQRSTVGKRHVPAEVRRAVFDRDGGRCTFVSESGRRCDERRDLELDHMDPFARGGEAKPERMRLLCRPHNQFTAEQTFGSGFMEQKRRQAKLMAAERRAMEHARGGAADVSQAQRPRGS